MLLVALIKESILDSYALYPLPHHGYLWQAGAERNTQHIHQPCLSPTHTVRLEELHGTQNESAV